MIFHSYVNVYQRVNTCKQTPYPFCGPCFLIRLAKSMVRATHSLLTHFFRCSIIKPPLWGTPMKPPVPVSTPPRLGPDPCSHRPCSCRGWHGRCRTEAAEGAKVAGEEHRSHGKIEGFLGMIPCKSFPDAPCMVCFPTFWVILGGKVGKSSIDGASGISNHY